MVALNRPVVERSGRGACYPTRAVVRVVMGVDDVGLYLRYLHAIWRTAKREPTAPQPVDIIDDVKVCAM